MAVIINGFRVEDEAIQNEALRIAPEVQKQFPWLDPVAQRLQSEDIARDRIIEHRLLFEASKTRLEPLSSEEVEREFTQYAQTHGGEKAFLQKFKLSPQDLPSVKSQMADDLRFRRFIAQINESVADPLHDEIERFYEDKKSRFRIPDQYKAAHIVFHTNNGQDPVQAKRKIDDAQEQLRNGASFEQIADEQSDCPGQGGDLGWFPEGHMVQEFEDVVFKLEVGQTSGVFETPFGFHIARLDDRKTGGYQPLEDVQSNIKEAILSERKETAFADLIEELKKSADIQLNQP